MAHLELVALVVREYEPAIEFFVNVLHFELVEDVPSLTNDGRPKRWVVVRPVGGATGILLARADGDSQAEIVGHQLAGRVGFFLRVNDFEATYAGCSLLPSCSSALGALRPTARSRCFWTSGATDGTSWAPPPNDGW